MVFVLYLFFSVFLLRVGYACKGKPSCDFFAGIPFQILQIPPSHVTSHKPQNQLALG